MRGELELVNRIRSVMGPVNPVPATANEGDQRFQAEMTERLATLRSADLVAFEQPGRRPIRPSRAGRDGDRGNIAWRLVAPALSGLAVVAVVVSLTLAAGQGPAARRSTGGLTAAASALPRFYVTVNSKGAQSPATAFVRGSLTGRTLGSVRLPESMGFYAAVAATKSDREFFIVADRTNSDFISVAGLYLLRLAEDGRVQSFTTISANLGLGMDNNIGGIALSPDGTKLAVAVQINVGRFPDAEIVVIPLNQAPRRVWVTRQERAFVLDPVWTSNKGIAFLWLDHLRGPNTNFISRCQERLLSTTAAGSNLLSSRVLATSGPTDKLGEVNFAFDVPRGGPIIAATSRNEPPLGLHGQATARLVALSPSTGKVIKVFGTRVMRYRNEATLIDADYFFQVYGFDASGSHVLVAAPSFGVLTDGKFTRLPGGPAHTIAAGW